MADLHPARPGAWLRPGLFAGLLLALALLGLLRGEAAMTSGGWVLVLLLAYMALLSIPFAPGVKLGLVLLMTLGPAGAPLVWAATVAGLATAYGLGRHLPASLRDRMPTLPARLATGRYALLALALNVPGNAILGGGGGLAMAAGASAAFRPVPTLAAIALAVAPVPVAVWTTGTLLL